MKTKQIIFFTFSLFVLVLFFNNVSAASQCWVDTGSSPAAAAGACTSSTLGGGAGKVLMYLSGSTNAHGALASTNSYNSVLCCNFGNGGVSCNDNADPTINNQIIGISSATNAHAEKVDFEDTTFTPQYTTNKVCYDSLAYCWSPGVDTDGDPIDCDTIEVEVLDLSSATNAHIAEAGNASYANNKICCVVATAAPPAPTECTPGTTYSNSACTIAGTGYICNADHTCSAATTCTPTVTSCPIGYSCGSVDNGCGTSIPCGTCPNPPYCDTSAHTCTATEPPGCTLDRAYWEKNMEEINSNEDTNTLLEDISINLVVEGTDCNNLHVSFEILEDLNIAGNEIIATPTADFSDSRATGTWTTEWWCEFFEFGIGCTNNPEFKFIATVTDNSGNVIGTINSFISDDVRGGELLRVKSGSEGEACEDVQFCSEYSLALSCFSDSCNRAKDSSPTDPTNPTIPLYDCTASNIECGCKWDGSTLDGDGIECEFDGSIRSPPPSTYTYCGDGQIHKPTNEDTPRYEVCDIGNLASSIPENLDSRDPCTVYNPSLYNGGTLACSSSTSTACKAFDTSGCLSPDPPECGDGEVNNGLSGRAEQCDGTNFNGWDCQLLRGDGGTLACGAATTIDECKIDASGCIPGECRVETLDPTDTPYNDCGSTNSCVGGRCVVGTGGCLSQTDCSSNQICAVGNVCVDKGTGGDSVDNSCSIDEDCNPGEEICVEGIDGTKTCVLDGEDPVGFTYCGDNVVQPDGNSLGKFEDCDGSIGTATCSSVSGGFYTGTGLECAFNCQYDYSSCTIDLAHENDPLCGNGIIDALDEECDPGTSALGDEDFGLSGNSCTNLGFDSGTLSCASDCKVDTASCTAPPPGDGLGNPRTKCTISTTGTDTCADDNFLTYTWSGVWKDLTTDTVITTCDLSDEECIKCTTGGTSTIACPAQVALPFFNIYNLIITSIAIALIYGAIILRRKGIIKIVD